MSFMHNVAAQKTNEILQLIDSVNESVQIEEIEQKIVLLLLKDEEYNQVEYDVGISEVRLSEKTKEICQELIKILTPHKEDAEEMYELAKETDEEDLKFFKDNKDKWTATINILNLMILKDFYLIREPKRKQVTLVTIPDKKDISILHKGLNNLDAEEIVGFYTAYEEMEKKIASSVNEEGKITHFKTARHGSGLHEFKNESKNNRRIFTVYKDISGNFRISFKQIGASIVAVLGPLKAHNNKHADENMKIECQKKEDNWDAFVQSQTNPDYLGECAKAYNRFKHEIKKRFFGTSKINKKIDDFIEKIGEKSHIKRIGGENDANK